VTAKPVPLNVNSTQSAHFRTLLGSGTTVVLWAVISAILFTIGAAKHWVGVMVLGPVAVGLVILIYCWYRADQQAENEFFGRFSAAHGLNHWAKYAIPEFTPLLAGGDRRHCEHWMENKGRGLGWFTFEVRRENGDKPDTWEPHHFTVAAVDIGEHGMARFQGIYLRRKRGIFDRLDSDANWLKNKHLENVELESTAFCETYELYRDRDQDELVMRQLFAPTFVVWLAEHPLKPGFELRAGQLVVFIPGRCGEAGKLQFLMMAATDISKRIQAELSEAAQAGSL
jgi:hypothetical protein